jgi:hypothetical protein
MKQEYPRREDKESDKVKELTEKLKKIANEN